MDMIKEMAKKIPKKPLNIGEIEPVLAKELDEMGSLCPSD
jgi:hypothetical protein